jgi:hypothetical protein
MSCQREAIDESRARQAHGQERFPHDPLTTSLEGKARSPQAQPQSRVSGRTARVIKAGGYPGCHLHHGTWPEVLPVCPE